MSASAADAFFPEPLTGLNLQALAAHAIDAAHEAGASYADVRVGERYFLSLQLSGDSILPLLNMRATFTYGVRVLVDGAWSFAHGTDPALDAIAKTARNAVSTARGYARLATRRVEFDAVLPARGEWETPVEIDPFTVPLRDQSALLWAYRRAAERVRDGSASNSTDFNWTRETRAFASSEGARYTQIFRTSHPHLNVSGNVGLGDWGSGVVTLRVPHTSGVSGGYEHVARPEMQETLVKLTDDAVRLARFPRRSLDVGRYPVVVDGTTFGALLGRTMSPALELDRVLGHEADASGSSYLSPPSALLGAPIARPLLNIQGDRALPSISAVRWDDEGVEARAFPVVTDGKLMNYYVSRGTVPEIHKDGRRLLSALNGCAVALDAADPVMVRAPHITVKPSSRGCSLDELCRGIERGVLIRNADYVMTDHQLASGALYFGGVMLAIEHGTIAYRIDGNGLQFNTAKLWKSLEALGDARTVDDVVVPNQKGQPWRSVAQHVTAPAGLFTDVNVTSTKI